MDIKRKIEIHLHGEPLEIKQLIAKLEEKETVVMRVVRWMLDQGNITLNSLDQLVWKHS